MGRRIFAHIALILTIATALLGCTFPTRNQPAQSIPPATNYAWRTLPPGRLPGTVVIVTASGGGTRAAALALSVLRALDKVSLAAGGTLAENLDILSSVSGGSVTAAYFALHGPKGLDSLRTRFLEHDGMAELIGSLANPVGLVRVATPKTERIDFLIEYFDRSLFPRHETYADLMGRRPLLVLNAADMVEGVPFALTQTNFSLLCSDLSKLPLSVGVAASAAFPVALTPVTLKNYSRCPAQDHTTWPPAYVQDTYESDWKEAPEDVTMARVQRAYATGEKAYLHLLDGGIADNLGVAEPYRILTTNAPSPGLLNAISDGRIDKIIVVMINARSAPASRLDRKPDTPNMIDMLMGTVNAAVDRAAAGSAFRLRNALRARYGEEANMLEQQNARETDAAAKASNRVLIERLRRVADNAALVEIDFDAIPDPVCRLGFHSIGTSWTNSHDEIEALLLMGEALMLNDRDYREKLLAAVNGTHTGQSPTIDEACTRLSKHG